MLIIPSRSGNRWSKLRAAICLSFGVVWTLGIAGSAQSQTGGVEKPEARMQMGSDFDTAIEKAAKERKKVLLIITHESSAGCRYFEANILTDAGVKKFLTSEFVPVGISASSPMASKLHNELSLYGLPAFVVFNSDRKVHSSICGCPKQPDSFIGSMRQLVSGSVSVVGSKGAAQSKNPSFLQGGKEMFAGKYDEAIKSFDQAIKEDPKCWEAYNDRASVYFAQGKMEQALHDYDRAIELNPKQAVLYVGRGNVLDTMGKPAEALKAYSRAIELDPKDPEGFFNRAVAYMHTKELEKARVDYGTAIKLYKDLGDKRRILETQARLDKLGQQ